jgi:nucleoside-diphosphate-sugar epimerase/uncharacterized membrane protein
MTDEHHQRSEAGDSAAHAGTKEVVLITGASGHIGSALIRRLAGHYTIVGLDRPNPPYPIEPAHCVPFDITSEDSVAAAMSEVAEKFGTRIAAVIHLAAFFSFKGDPNPLYETVNVAGTARLLRHLQSLEVEQFIFSSSMLVHSPTEPGKPIREDWPLDPAWDYPRSKRDAEQAIREEHGDMPYLILRIAGVYNDDGGLPALAQQIQRIYERKLISHVFPGDTSHGQAAVHLDDLAELFALAVEKRRQLQQESTCLVGEPEVPSYEALQDEIGKLLYGKPWELKSIPKPVAKSGAWLEELALPEDKEPFIKHWMIDLADQHYELDIGRAEQQLGWQPQHRLMKTLPNIIHSLRQDPAGWYKRHKLEYKGPEKEESQEADKKTAKQHEGGDGEHSSSDMLLSMHHSMLWPHWVNLMLGFWLLTSPFLLGYMSDYVPDANALRVMAERDLPSFEFRNLAMTWSDVISGLLVVIFSLLSADPKRRFSWSQWANAAVGTWLLFAPLVFWTPLPEAYANDSLVGALIIAFAVLIPMMPGMSMEGMMGGPDVPPSWSYCPSTFVQRLPIAALGFFGLLISRYLTAYQLGHIDSAWDPFFGKGTETIITSETSKAWPVADAGVGAVAYTMEVLMAVMGSKVRWRTMPWMVLAFGILVVPLGGVSIFFIIIQPIVIGTWCTLCLVAALAMLIMIPYSLDELVAMGQFMVDAKRRGKPFWRTFWMGGAMEGGSDDASRGFTGSPRSMAREMSLGVTLPWTLVVSSIIGVWLMFTRLVFDSTGAMANSDHLMGALIVTVAVMALGEVGRPLRFINIAFGVWLLLAPWILEGTGSTWAIVNSLVSGLAVILLSIPRGPIKYRYGSWNRYIV